LFFYIQKKKKQATLSFENNRLADQTIEAGYSNFCFVIDLVFCFIPISFLLLVQNTLLKVLKKQT
jgi:hypothetical protein